MAVADDTVKPSPPPPPPPRIVIAVLALVPFVLAPMLALMRVVGVVARALPYLGYAVVWVLAASSAAQVVASRAWGESSASSVFLQALSDAAFKVFLCGVFPFLALAAVLLCGTCLAYVIAVISGSGSEFKKGRPWNMQAGFDSGSPHCSPWMGRVCALHVPVQCLALWSFQLSHCVTGGMPNLTENQDLPFET